MAERTAATERTHSTSTCTCSNPLLCPVCRAHTPPGALLLLACIRHNQSGSMRLLRFPWSPSSHSDARHVAKPCSWLRKPSSSAASHHPNRNRALVTSASPRLAPTSSLQAFVKACRRRNALRPAGEGVLHAAAPRRSAPPTPPFLLATRALRSLCRAALRTMCPCTARVIQTLQAAPACCTTKSTRHQ